MDVADRRVSLRYTFNLQQISTAASLYVLRHGCLSKSFVVVPPGYRAQGVVDLVSAKLREMGVEFGFLDFRDEKLRMENLLTLSALLPTFVGLGMHFRDDFRYHRPGYYYACCEYYWRLRRAEAARVYCSGETDAKPLRELEARVNASFHEGLKNPLLDDYVRKFSFKDEAQAAQSAVQRKVGYGVKKLGIHIVIEGPDVDDYEDAE